MTETSRIADPLPLKTAHHFDDVNVWIFDLDNTLYPHECQLWPQVDQRITLWHDAERLDG